MVCASEKYASEIEIFTFGRGFRTQISRSSVQKKAFSLVNDQAVLADRLFQQNRPKAVSQLVIDLLEIISVTLVGSYILDQVMLSTRPFMLGILISQKK